jgi:hypothetical protein
MYPPTPNYVLIDFDMFKKRDLASVEVTYYNYISAGLESPSSMELSYSADGTTYSSPVTITGFKTEYTQPYKTKFTLDVNGVRYVKAKINPTGTKWVMLSEFKFNDKPRRAGDFDESGNVDLADLAVFSDEWLNAGTEIHGETAVVDNFEQYASDEDLESFWFEYYAASGTSPVIDLLTSPSSAHSGSKALRWQYNVTNTTPGTWVWAEMLYSLATPINLSQYDILNIWLKRDAGNSLESLLYIKFLNNVNDNDHIAGQAGLTADEGSTKYPEGTWQHLQVDLHNLDYSEAKDRGYTSLDQITNVTGILFGVIGQDGGTGFINMDDIVLEKGQACDLESAADINGDCKVNFGDFSKFAVNWLFAN